MRIKYLSSCFLIVCICIVALGPYILPTIGMRLEHFFIYTSFFYTVMIKMWTSADGYVPKNIFFLTLLCLAVPFWMLIATIQNFNLDNTYKLMSAMENFSQPVALVIIIFFVAKPLNRLERLSLLRIASITIILMLCLN